LGRYKQLFTRGELKAKLNYISDNKLTSLVYGSYSYGKHVKPILVKGVDWYESKLGNIFYYNSALKKLKKHLGIK